MWNNYFKISWRNLFRNRVNSSLNIMGLAMGIAIVFILGIWLRHELSFDKFHPDADRIYRVVNTFSSESESFAQAISGPALGARLDEEIGEIEAACRYYKDNWRVKMGELQFFENNIIIADSNFLEFFHFPLISGDPKKVLCDRSQIVLTESLAQKYFGRTDPIGQVLVLDDDTEVQVSGLLEDPPENSQIQFSAILPMDLLYHYAVNNWNNYRFDDQWVGGWMYTFVKLNPDASYKMTASKINAVVADHSKDAWESHKMSYTYQMQRLTDVHLQSHLRYDIPSNGSIERVWVFTTIGFIILLLACINYMNLTTAAALDRAKESGIRKVVGATRRQLFTQFLVDATFVTAIALVLGFLMFQFLLPAFSLLTDTSYSVHLNWQSLLIVLMLMFGVVLLAGSYPALLLSSFKPLNIVQGTFSRSRGGILIRKGLVLLQFTASLGLISGIIIVRQQMKYVQEKELGYKGDTVLEINYQGADQVNDQAEILKNRLMDEPSVQNVSFHGGNVVGGLGNTWTTTIDQSGNEISTSAYQITVDPDYFDTYELKLAAGRFFSPEIASDTMEAVMVNEAAVRTFSWGAAENAIGKTFGKGENLRTVVGVVRDFHFESLHKPVEALIIHFERSPGRMSLKVNEALAGQAIVHLEKTWKEIIPDIPLEYSFIDSKVEAQYGAERNTEIVFTILSILSLFIACLGLFGLVIYMVRQKMKEIGIRKVLGAPVSSIVFLLSKDFMKLILIAGIIAAPVSWYLMNHWLQDFAYRTDIHWWVFVFAAIAALVLALFTISFHSLRAARSNPVDSLRNNE